MRFMLAFCLVLFFSSCGIDSNSNRNYIISQPLKEKSFSEKEVTHIQEEDTSP